MKIFNFILILMLLVTINIAPSYAVNCNRYLEKKQLLVLDKMDRNKLHSIEGHQIKVEFAFSPQKYTPSGFENHKQEYLPGEVSPFLKEYLEMEKYGPFYIKPHPNSEDVVVYVGRNSFKGVLQKNGVNFILRDGATTIDLTELLNQEIVDYLIIEPN